MALVAHFVRWRWHGRLSPVALDGIGFLLIGFTMLISYERIIELLGFGFLCADAILDWRIGRPEMGA